MIAKMTNCGVDEQNFPVLDIDFVEDCFVKSNVDEERDFALKNGIMSIPCIIAFIDGKPVDKCVGLVSESALCEFVEKHIGRILWRKDKQLRYDAGLSE